MPRLNWIEIENYSFNSILLMEEFQLRLICRNPADPAWRANMGVALRANPAVRWYMARRHPACAPLLDELVREAPAGDIRAAELAVLAGCEDFVTYTTPEVMAEGCDFIRTWDAQRLLELTDFAGKRVLDVGSGSGRLAFAAQPYAKEVYASEPVATLRAYLRERIAREGIANMRVADGMADSLPYPDDAFDIVMSGHVVGDDPEREIAELTRVARSGGVLIDCPGDSATDYAPSEEASAGGWAEHPYRCRAGGIVYRYTKQVEK